MNRFNDETIVDDGWLTLAWGLIPSLDHYQIWLEREVAGVLVRWPARRRGEDHFVLLDGCSIKGPWTRGRFNALMVGLGAVPKHYHVAGEEDIDECAQCGLDIRNDVHLRAGELDKLLEIAHQHSTDPLLANIEQGVRDGLAASEASE